MLFGKFKVIKIDNDQCHEKDSDTFPFSEIFTICIGAIPCPHPTTMLVFRILIDSGHEDIIFSVLSRHSCVLFRMFENDTMIMNHVL